MSSDCCLALLLDSPMQSWGHASRFDRRLTALHPTRSGLFGLIAAAMGIDKHGPNEAAQLKRLESIRLTTVSLERRDRRGESLPMIRLEDYHTVTGIRRASGKLEKEATVQTYRHYLLDARFGALLEGPSAPLEEIAAALRDPKWGVWFGRKSCLPASPILAAGPASKADSWAALLRRVGLTDSMAVEDFVHVIETTPIDPAADRIDDTPVAYGSPIGSRHAPRWIKPGDRSPNSAPPS